MSSSERARFTRGQFLKAAGAAAAGFVPLGPSAARAATEPRVHPWAPAAEAAGGGAGPLLSFHSRPDLRPPRVTVTHGPRALPRSADAYWFLAPGKAGGVQIGPLIVGQHGRVVWFRPVPPNWYVMNFRAQVYRGKPVLTWWQGTVLGGL